MNSRTVDLTDCGQVTVGDEVNPFGVGSARRGDCRARQHDLARTFHFAHWPGEPHLHDWISMTYPSDKLLRIDEQAQAEKLSGSESPFSMLFERGEVSLLLWAPRAVDTQSPHDRDEIYIVSSGAGLFRRGQELVEFRARDALFVPAGVEHRFENLSPDFRTWVIFFGARRKSIDAVSGERSAQ